MDFLYWWWGITLLWEVCKNWNPQTFLFVTCQMWRKINSWDFIVLCFLLHLWMSNDTSYWWKFCTGRWWVWFWTCWVYSFSSSVQLGALRRSLKTLILNSWEMSCLITSPCVYLGFLIRKQMCAFQPLLILIESPWTGHSMRFCVTD